LAIFSLSASTISRATGKSVVAAVAYRAAVSLHDRKRDLRFDFTRKSGVIQSGIIAPPGAPSWASDRAELWNRAEEAEDSSTRHAIAKTGREFRVALPHELDQAEQIELVKEFAQFLVDRYGVAADWALHKPDHHGDQRNIHTHVTTSTRRLGPDGFAEKIRILDSPKTSGEQMEQIREKWAELANAALERAGSTARIDHRSYQSQGIDREATVHLGPAASALERDDRPTELGDLNRQIRGRNAVRERLERERDEISAELMALETEALHLDRQEAEPDLVEPLADDQVLQLITQTQATFSERDIRRVVAAWESDPRKLKRTVREILCRNEVIALRDPSAPGRRRYTTVDVVVSEREGLAAAAALAADQSHAVSRRALIEIMERAAFGSMREDQRQALIKVTSGAGLQLVAGEAGTGKSYLNRAIIQAIHADRPADRVVGLAFTNRVVRDMARDGFDEARTVAGAIGDAKRGRLTWNAHTTVIVDEAAQLSTSDLVKLLQLAQKTGARLILTGDTAQLSSIARGGLFGALAERHGAATLTEVTRVKDADQRVAFNAMHKGDFKTALRIFDRRGFVGWSETQDEARAALVQQWAIDSLERPEATRQVFAYTNAEAQLLNMELRQIRRDRGELGVDHILPTKVGDVAFAAGDRIKLTSSARARADREAGLVNGGAGTIVDITDRIVTLALDAKPGEQPRHVRFRVGEDGQAGELSIAHALASTIYSGQGQTVDEAMVLHASGWRAASSYVAMSRARSSVRVFTSRDAVRGNEPWMAETGGYGALSPEHQESARTSYAAWVEEKPHLGRRYGLADYVEYVQGKWAGARAHGLDLDALARQMGRREETRAASQFEILPHHRVIPATYQIARDLEPPADRNSARPRQYRVDRARLPRFVVDDSGTLVSWMPTPAPAAADLSSTTPQGAAEPRPDQVEQPRDIREFEGPDMTDDEIEAAAQHHEDLAAHDELVELQWQANDVAFERVVDAHLRELEGGSSDDVPFDEDEPVSERPTVPVPTSRNAEFLLAVKSFTQAYDAMGSELSIAERVRTGSAAVERLGGIQHDAPRWEGAREWLEECAALGITRPAIALELQQLRQVQAQLATRGRQSSDSDMQ